MRFRRSVWAACIAAPAALLVASAATATPTAVGHRRLPANIHQRHDGRFLQAMCDEGKTIHCRAMRLLPEDFDPWKSPLPLAVPEKKDAGGGGGGGGGTSGSPPSGGLGPSEIAAAYNLASLPQATGAIVAIVDSPDMIAVSDLAGYRSGYGLPALPTCPTSTNGGLPVPGGTPCFAAVDENGNLHTATSSDDDANGDVETALDMDMISAVCPECSILLVQLTSGTSGTSQDIVTAVQTAAKLGAVATSISLGGPEATDPIQGGQGGGTDPTGYTTPGHLVFVAAGDFGFDNETFCAASGQCSGTATTPSYPASSPDVIAVGGTLLYNNNGSYSETVWDDGTTTGQQAQDITTSGCSTEFNALSWQTPLLSGTTCTKRATADISAVAAYTTTGSPGGGATSDIVIYTTASGSGISGFSGGMEGTSAASPLLAAVFTKAGLTNIVSNNLGWPYAHPTAFNDVTSGNDDPMGTQCSSQNKILCTAGPGWDGPTGMGTPNGPALLAAAGTNPPPPPVDAGSDATVQPPHNDASVPPHDASTPPTNWDAASGTTDSGSWSTGDGAPTQDGPLFGKPEGSGCDLGGAGSGGSGLGATGLLLGLGAFVSRRRRRS